MLSPFTVVQIVKDRAIGTAARALIEGRTAVES